MRQSLIQSIVVFVAFALAAAVLLIVAPTQADLYARSVLLAFGAALFGAGLTVLLVRVTSLFTAQR
jgi:hypothetical protein